MIRCSVSMVSNLVTMIYTPLLMSTFYVATRCVMLIKLYTYNHAHFLSFTPTHTLGVLI